jgi:hypothetical protein
VTMIDGQGRCCGRKTMHYKRGYPPWHFGPHLFCPRCDRSYDPDTLAQTENWAWMRDGDEFKPRPRDLKARKATSIIEKEIEF